MDDDSRRLLVLGIYHFANDGSLALFASALPVMRTNLGLSFVEIGTILSAGLMGTMALQLLFGSLSDLGHAGRVLLLGFAAIVIMDLLLPAGSSFVQVLVFYVLLRCAAAVYHPVSSSSIARTYAENKTAAFGYQGAIGDLGLTFATLSTGVLSQVWGWRVPFWVWGALGALLLVYFITTVLRRKVRFYHQSTLQDQRSKNNSGGLNAVKLDLAKLAIVTSLTTASFLVFTGYMPLYFNVIEGLSPALSATFVAAWIAVGVLAGLVTGRVVSKLKGEVRTLQLTFATETALLLVAYLLLYQWLRVPFGSLVRGFAIILTGLPVFVAFPAVNGLLGLRMPHKRLGLIYAVNLSLGLMVASLFTYMNGYLASITSMAVTLPVLLIIAALGTVASLLL